jgi:hypothetical protein
MGVTATPFVRIAAVRSEDLPPETMAAAIGLEAALRAKAGLPASAATYGSFVENEDTSHSGAFGPHESLTFGQPPRPVVSPGHAIRTFPRRFAASAGLALHGTIPHLNAIRAMALVMPWRNRRSPETGLAGKFSPGYTVVNGPLDGKADRHPFTERRLDAPGTRTPPPKIAAVMDEATEARIETMHARPQVALGNGPVLETWRVGPADIRGRAPIGMDTEFRDKWSPLPERGI